MSSSFLNDVIRWTKTILLLVIQLQSHIDFNHKSYCLLWKIILHFNTAISLKIQVHQEPTILMTSYAWDYFVMNLDCSTYWWRQFLFRSQSLKSSCLTGFVSLIFSPEELKPSSDMSLESNPRLLEVIRAVSDKISALKSEVRGLKNDGLNQVGLTSSQFAAKIS